MGLVDTHCHLQSQRFDSDRPDVLERSLTRLDWLVVIGDDIPSSQSALALVQDRIYASVGVHPYYAKDLDEAMLATLRELAQQPGVVALGEMGLDYFNEYSPRDAQARAFEQQLELACELGLPVVIHNRDADDDSYAILKNFAPRMSGCIMHCFSSGAAFAERCVDLGFHISFAGNLTFPKAAQLREAAKATPAERLLVETDAPYLAPPPYRGKRCEPWHVQYTAEVLAELKGEELRTFETRLGHNAATVYNISTEPAAV